MAFVLVLSPDTPSSSAPKPGIGEPKGGPHVEGAAKNDPFANRLPSSHAKPFLLSMYEYEMEVCQPATTPRRPSENWSEYGILMSLFTRSISRPLPLPVAAN